MINLVLHSDDLGSSSLQHLSLVHEGVLGDRVISEFLRNILSLVVVSLRNVVGDLAVGLREDVLALNGRDVSSVA